MVEADIKLTEEKFEIAKVEFNECLTSLWGQDNKVELFGLGRLTDIKAWPMLYLCRKRPEGWKDGKTDKAGSDTT
jgi:hypothetical protein